MNARNFACAWKGKKMKKTIITVVGKDTVGIIAKVCTYLAENKINILDISQTIVQGYFNMMMIVDMNQTQKHFGDIVEIISVSLCLDIEMLHSGFGLSHCFVRIHFDFASITLQYGTPTTTVNSHDCHILPFIPFLQLIYN